LQQKTLNERQRNGCLLFPNVHLQSRPQTVWYSNVLVALFQGTVHPSAFQQMQLLFGHGKLQLLETLTESRLGLRGGELD
jgi:hypothetical protein